MKTQNLNKRKISRRAFINRLWAALGIVAGIESIFIAYNFLRPRKSKTNNPITYFEAGPAENFSNNSITGFRNRNLFLVKNKKGEFLALSSKCTHLGCALKYDKEKNHFVCPCHSSIFNTEGKVLRSPATYDLDRHPVVIEKGIVKINTRNLIAIGSKNNMRKDNISNNIQS